LSIADELLITRVLPILGLLLVRLSIAYVRKNNY
jgi:hypothetical protein